MFEKILRAKYCPYVYLSLKLSMYIWALNLNHWNSCAFFFFACFHKSHLLTWSKNFWNQKKFVMTSMDFETELNYCEMFLIEKNGNSSKPKLFLINSWFWYIQSLENHLEIKVWNCWNAEWSSVFPILLLIYLFI